MSLSGASSSDYYNSLPSSSSGDPLTSRRVKNSWAESSIDSYFRDEGYFSLTAPNGFDSRRTSASFANQSIDDRLDEVTTQRPYLDRIDRVIENILQNNRNVSLPRYSSAESMESLDPYAERPGSRFYGREYYSSDSSPENRHQFDYCRSKPSSSSQENDESDECLDRIFHKSIPRARIKSKRISINEPPVTAFFRRNSSVERGKMRKVQSLREEPPKSILKKSSVKSEGRCSALQNHKYHVYEVIPEEHFRYDEQRPDPRPPLPERPIMRPLVIFPPEPLFQPRSLHAYHRRNSVIVD